MYTLIALRSCVSTADIGVLTQMLQDPDRIVRMTAANVLAYSVTQRRPLELLAFQFCGNSARHRPLACRAEG